MLNTDLLTTLKAALEADKYQHRQLRAALKAAKAAGYPVTAKLNHKIDELWDNAFYLTENWESITPAPPQPKPQLKRTLAAKKLAELSIDATESGDMYTILSQNGYKWDSKMKTWKQKKQRKPNPEKIKTRRAYDTLAALGYEWDGQVWQLPPTPYWEAETPPIAAGGLDKSDILYDTEKQQSYIYDNEKEGWVKSTSQESNEVAAQTEANIEKLESREISKSKTDRAIYCYLHLTGDDSNDLDIDAVIELLEDEGFEWNGENWVRPDYLDDYIPSDDDLSIKRWKTKHLLHRLGIDWTIFEDDVPAYAELESLGFYYNDERCRWCGGGLADIDTVYDTDWGISKEELELERMMIAAVEPFYYEFGVPHFNDGTISPEELEQFKARGYTWDAQERVWLKPSVV